MWWRFLRFFYQFHIRYAGLPDPLFFADPYPSICTYRANGIDLNACKIFLLIFFLYKYSVFSQINSDFSIGASTSPDPYSYSE
jgi:hypothetical protein